MNNKAEKKEKVSVYEAIEGDKWISKQCTKFTSQDYKSCDQDLFRYSSFISKKAKLYVNTFYN